MVLHVSENKRGVAVVTLNRPEVHNAFNDALITELRDTFLRLADAPNVRLAVLRGAGPSFCAGADLTAMKALKQAGEAENRKQSELLASMFDALDRFPAPLIGVVQGAALGGGTGLAAVCDYVLATPDARFGLTEVRLGLVPAVISPYILAKIGLSQARAYVLSGLAFDADQAERIGLVHQIVEDPEWLEAAVDDLVADFLKAAPDAARQGKQLLRDLPEVADVTDHTTRMIARIRTGEEGQEGMDAFLNKRKPRWVEGI